MRTQLSELRAQEAGLRAQSSGLRRQLDQMLQTNPARPGVQQQWADVGVQLAKVQGDVATLQARLGQNVIIQDAGPMPGFNRRSGPDPDMVIGLSFALVFVIAIPMSIAYAKRIWKGKPQPAAPPMADIAPRLDRLEQAVDAIAIEIERVSEGQRFVTKILAERPVAAAAASAPGADNGAAGDAKPILALGAGPMEPVRAPERQSVRQSGTPR